jgi:prefoldin alpha subunit
MSEEKERRLRRIITEIQMMEGSVNTYQQRLQIISAVLSELKVAQQSLRDLKDVNKGNPLLVPVGGGVFMNAELGDIKKVIVDIGADISIGMDFENAVQNIDERLGEMEDAQNSVIQHLSQIIAQLEAHQQTANRLSVELQGALQGVG